MSLSAHLLGSMLAVVTGKGKTLVAPVAPDRSLGVPLALTVTVGGHGANGVAVGAGVGVAPGLPLGPGVGVAPGPPGAPPGPPPTGPGEGPTGPGEGPTRVGEGPTGPGTGTPGPGEGPMAVATPLESVALVACGPVGSFCDEQAT